ncbi:uncharacterized protein ARMOST_16060 [Armillaria ostoyae]|uniref:Uncharacterized protein n=1 Tax=Armillaria ostoyae TaxID=47428 RepID=A0A284RV52_ARMOS|nr:uncharacterized protein ARMOST_16060 [Armillaria ostoyae]
MDNKLLANVTDSPAVIEAMEKALFQALKECQIVNYVINAFWPGAPFLFCKVWYYIGEWVAYSLFIPTTIFLGLRTYALFREKGIAYKWLIISLVAARIIEFQILRIQPYSAT